MRGRAAAPLCRAVRPPQTRIVRRLLPVLIIAVVPLTAILAPSAARAATAASACSGTIDIEQFAFNPPTVPAGQPSTLSLVAQNCTNQTLPGQIIWYGLYTWPGTGIPPGCPAIDPAVIPITLGPQASYTATGQDGSMAGCLATGLQETVQFTVNNVGTVAKATADLTIVQPTPPIACQVVYTPNIWPGGFTATVAISIRHSGAQRLDGYVRLPW